MYINILCRIMHYERVYNGINIDFIGYITQVLLGQDQQPR